MRVCCNRLSDFHQPVGPGQPAAGWGMADIAESRLPIHLQYPLTDPGTYMVRYTRLVYRQAKMEVAEQSEWTTLHVQVAPPDQIENWLRSKLAALTDTSGPLLGNALPALLANRDVRVLRLMLDSTYHPNSAVAGYAANSSPLPFVRLLRRDGIVARYGHRCRLATFWPLNECSFSGRHLSMLRFGLMFSLVRAARRRLGRGAFIRSARIWLRP
jgi:hypothetical protein